MIDKKERILYANLLSRFLEGDREQLKIASLLGYRLLRRSVHPEEILDLHTEALRGCLPSKKGEGNGEKALRTTMRPLRTLFIGYSESYRDALSSLEERSRELEAKTDSLEKQVEERTRELDESRKELQEKLAEISKDQVAMLSMIEDQNRVNRELRATREKLASSEKLAILGKLSLGLSHELRNPLGVIESSAGLLENSFGPKEEDLRKWTLRIREQTRICNRVIQGILGFSVREEGARYLFPVERAVEKAVERCKAATRIEVKALTNRSLWIKGDEEQITQALRCLVANGLEAMEPNGKLIVSIDSGSGGKVHGRSCATITVTDSGCGIEEEKLSLISEPFYSTKEGSLGLGLPLAEAIVRKHHGTITVRSIPGEGTSVTVSIPLEEAEGNGEENNIPHRR
jgi:signal transduction histidine kinase